MQLHRESLREQQKWLKHYPKLGGEKREGAVYLEILLSLLKISGEKEKYKEVREYAKVINA